MGAAVGPRDDRSKVPEHERGEIAGSGGAPTSTDPHRDDTLQHPRCVFQVLKRHFSRYTPEMVHEVCGIAPEVFAAVAEALTRNSGRERTSAFCYAVGWTHHTVGVQYIRAASILQMLLGNIGRPGGGILALRGHASIQGSTDIPTLFDMLPGLHPDAARAPRAGPGDLHRREHRRQGLLGQHGRLRREPAQGLVRRCRHARTTTSASTTCPGSTATTPASRR